MIPQACEDTVLCQTTADGLKRFALNMQVISDRRVKERIILEAAFFRTKF